MVIEFFRLRSFAEFPNKPKNVILIENKGALGLIITITPVQYITETKNPVGN